MKKSKEKKEVKDLLIRNPNCKVHLTRKNESLRPMREIESERMGCKQTEGRKD